MPLMICGIRKSFQSLTAVVIGCSVLVVLDSSTHTRAADPKPAAGEVKRSQWNKFDRLDFQVDGRDAILIVPPKADVGKPWIWRTEFFGHEPQVDIALVGKGFHVAYVNVQNLYGAPKALDAMDVFYDHVTREYGLMP